MRPNLLLITTDQQRWDGLALNGNPVLQTPYLDALAAGGVNFTRAYTTTPSCIAARRTILTGQHGVTHKMVGYQDGVEFFPEFTLPGLLGQAGYQTQLIGKLHQFPQRKRYGFDNVVLSEQIDYRPDSPFFRQNDYMDWLKEAVGPRADSSLHGVGANSRLARPYHLAEEYHHSTWVTQEAVKFLTRTRDPSCPWFLHLSFWAPHPPLVPPQVYYDRYAGNRDWRPRIGSWVPQFQELRSGLNTESATGPFKLEEMRNAMAGYYGLINHVDDCLAYLFRRIHPRGLRRAEEEQVWIIFTSDHGEMLGDHHLFRKSLPYEGSAHVPFFVSTVNLPLPSRSSPALVCLEDVLPTFLDLAGVRIPAGVDGKSLAPVLRGETDQVREELFEEHSGGFAHHSVICGRHKYIWFARTNEEQLFDLEADPHELNDLSGDAGLLTPLRKTLARRLRGRKDYTYDLAKLRPLANTAPGVFWRTAS